MKKLLFIMNPFAGTKKANRFLADIISIFNRAGYDVLTYMTAAPGDCVTAVVEKAAGMDLIVCAGGDGQCVRPRDRPSPPGVLRPVPLRKWLHRSAG